MPEHLSLVVRCFCGLLSGFAMGLLSILVLRNSGGLDQLQFQEPAIAMASQIMQPPRNQIHRIAQYDFDVDDPAGFTRHVLYEREPAAATASADISNKGVRVTTVVRAETLNNVIPESPLKDVAMSAIANANQCDSVKATPDPQVKMSSIDDVTKSKLSKMAEEVVSTARDMAGITAPMNFFDPLGFSAPIHVAEDGETVGTSKGRLLFYREAELKHGRVCMLASLGILVGEHFHPLFGGNIDVPSYIAFQLTPLQTFWPAVLVAVALPEMFSVFTFNPPWERPAEGWTMRSDHEPGNLGFDPLGLKPKDPKQYLDMQNKELNNGRLAMIAAAGMIAQEVATGKKVL